MKIIRFGILLVLFVSLFSSCDTQPKNQFTLEVKLTGVDDIMIFLKQYGDDGWVTLDSAMTVQGLANFSGTVGLPEMYFVGFQGTRSFVQIFLEPSDIKAQIDFADLNNLIVTGSESQKVFEDYNSSLQEIDGLFQEVNRQYQQAAKSDDKERLEELNQEFDELNEMKAGFIKNFCLKNNSTPVSPYIMLRNSYYFEYEDFDEITAASAPSIQSSIYVKSLKEKADAMRKVAIGQPFTDFTLNDPDGNPLPLSSAIGENYVLIDFWASWCIPCRRENPNIVAAYEEYHEKGFDIFGVSLDRDHGKWIAAIAQDSLTWNHVSDLKQWKSEAGKLYGVQSIPHSLLVSPEGIIIAKNLREAALHEKLAELLN